MATGTACQYLLKKCLTKKPLVFSFSVRDRRKSNHINHVSECATDSVLWLCFAYTVGTSCCKRIKCWSFPKVSPGLLSKKYSSCSTIFIDDSTVSQPNLKSTIKWSVKVHCIIATFLQYCL